MLDCLERYPDLDSKPSLSYRDSYLTMLLADKALDFMDGLDANGGGGGGSRAS
jgi:hypothetical protein